MTGIDPPGVKIDVAHGTLIYVLVRAQKPRTILEFGFGGGRSADAILLALKHNSGAYCYTLVDNWGDWGGTPPAEVEPYRERMEIVTATERGFVRLCEDQYEFIMSDADHLHTHEWFEDVFDRLLAPRGVLVYHDVCNPTFGDLQQIVYKCRERKISHAVFDRCSVEGEDCGRGLLVVFKE